MVIRVFPVVGITAPRFPFEKSYTFFIVSPFLGVGLPHGDRPRSTASRSVNHDHQRPERVHTDGDKPLLALSSAILDGERERVIQHPVALGKRHAVLLDVCRILFRVEFGGHTCNICTLCISVNDRCNWRALRPLSARQNGFRSRGGGPPPPGRGGRGGGGGG